MAAICVLTLLAMGYYFWRTTGNPIRTPYAVNAATYHPVPFFPWQRLRPAPQYNDPVLRDFYVNWRMKQYILARAHPFALLVIKLITGWTFFLGPLLTLPFFAGCLAVPYGFSSGNLSNRTRKVLSICVLAGAGLLLPVAFEAHYAAPLTCAFYYLVLATISRVRRWRASGRPVGLAVIRAVPTIAAIMVFAAAIPSLRATRPAPIPTWYSPIIYDSYRSQIVHELSANSGFHLVLVRYRADHNPMTEWVFNNADIDGSKVIWARDMGTAQNSELISYFKNRDVWLLQPDTIPPKLVPYFANDDTKAGSQ